MGKNNDIFYVVFWGAIIIGGGLWILDHLPQLIDFINRMRIIFG